MAAVAEFGNHRVEPQSKGIGPQILMLAGFLMLCGAAAWLGTIATTPNIPTWYASLAKPSFNPPNGVFPVAWGILYTLMAVAAWLVWRQPGSGTRSAALTLFLAQLVLNVAWSWAFFGAHSPVLGLIVILLLLIAIGWTGGLFRRVDAAAGWLMIPYFLWVAFASVLNASILALN